MKTLLILLFTISSLSAQIPINKPIATAKKQLRALLEKNGWTFSQEEQKDILMFSQEENQNVPSGKFYHALWFERSDSAKGGLGVEIYPNPEQKTYKIRLSFDPEAVRTERVLSMLQSEQWSKPHETKREYGVERVYGFKKYLIFCKDYGSLFVVEVVEQRRG